MKNWMWAVIAVAAVLIIMNVSGSLNSNKNTPPATGSSTSAPTPAEPGTPPVAPAEQ